MLKKQIVTHELAPHLQLVHSYQDIHKIIVLEHVEAIHLESFMFCDAFNVGLFHLIMTQDETAANLLFQVSWQLLSVATVTLVNGWYFLFILTKN